MSVVVNDAALGGFLRSTFGPVGRYLAIKADEVVQKARENASGVIIGIDTGDLISGISARIESDATGLYAVAKSDAIHRGFAYPAFHDQNGRPWLTNALRDVFR